MASVPDPSWASVVADSKSDLRFVAESVEAVKDGVLQIPKEIIAIGVKKLESALVAQFLDSIPPVKLR
ncbi:hypothetical protein LINPERPRIM_LOCUS24027 [Linum perenne]